MLVHFSQIEHAKLCATSVGIRWDFASKVRVPLSGKLTWKLTL